jgi:glycosyltransferase involved in cell wall biosynthesis
MTEDTQVTFSVIVPLADAASASQLRTCLEHLEKQTVPPKEVIVVLGDHASPELFAVLREFRETRIFERELKKCAARNLGARHAKGIYLVHIDVDTFLDSDALEAASGVIAETGAKAVFLGERVSPKNLLLRVKALERRLYLCDANLSAPQVVEADIFKRIGGFDDSVRILDEWTLYLRLRTAGVVVRTAGPKVRVDEGRSFRDDLNRKYKRGQYIPHLVEKYPEFRHIVGVNWLALLARNWRTLAEDPIATVGLAILKPVEWLALLAGSRRPPEVNMYSRKDVAASYNKARSSTNFGRFKNFTEEQCLRLLLDPLPQTVLEIGAGTGRITRFLQDLGIKVFPTEPSQAMIDEYPSKTGLPPVVRLSGEEIHPWIGTFDSVVGLRVLWHIKDRTRHREILCRAASRSTKWLLFDFASAKRYKNPVLYPLFRIYGLIFNKNFYRNDCFSTDQEISDLAKDLGVTVDKRLPLDLLTPLWLNLLPRGFAERLFPPLFSLEQRLADIITPGRWLVRFAKS